MTMQSEAETLPVVTSPASSDSASHGVLSDTGLKMEDTYAVSNEKAAFNESMDAFERATLEARSPANPTYVKEWEQKIKQAVTDQRKSIFEVADLLRHCSVVLYKKDFMKCWKAAGFTSWTSVQNYIRVAEAEHLRKPEFQPYLPARVGHLIDLVTWTEDEIRAAINSKLMCSNVPRSALKKWIKDVRGEPTGEQTEHPSGQSPGDSGYSQEDNGADEFWDADGNYIGPIYEAAFVVYMHQPMTLKDRDNLITMLEDYAPEAQAAGKQPPRYVVCRKLERKDDYGIDRWSDYQGAELTKCSGEWEPRYVDGPPGWNNPIRSDEELLDFAEPWDASLGREPGTKV